MENNFDHIQRTANSGFERNNAWRSQQGLEPYTEEQYAENHIKLQEKLLKSWQESLSIAEESIKRAKEDLKKREAGVYELKDMLKNAIDSGHDTNNILQTLEAYEKQFDTDALLDRISTSNKWIEELKKDIENTQKEILLLNNQQ